MWDVRNELTKLAESGDVAEVEECSQGDVFNMGYKWKGAVQNNGNDGGDGVCCDLVMMDLAPILLWSGQNEPRMQTQTGRTE